VGLVLHNVAMAQLWELGVRGTTLDVVAAWKEAFLLVALLVVAWHVRRKPAVTAADVLAASYAIVIALYWLIPQDVLGGEATARGELLALRHHLFPVAAYALGRLVALAWQERVRFGALVVLAAAVVAVVGLLDLAFVSLQAWRDSGVAGWYREQLGLDYEGGLSGLPENWVYNTGDEENPIRRLVSTFLSPLAGAYALVVALIYVISRPLRWWWALVAALLYVALLYTHTRAAFAALVFGLVVLAVAQRRLFPAVIGVASVAAGALFLVAYPSIGPSTSYTPDELEWLRENARGEPTGRDPFPADDASTESHWQNLRDGVRVVLEHPQGHGLGNAGVVAKRTGVDILAGESTYTELGVDAGIVGVLAFVLWSFAILAGLWRREAWLLAVFATVLALAVQTDVIGIHWLAFTVWAAAGLALGLPRRALQ
jgi:hypothetical protein